MAPTMTVMSKARSRLLTQHVFYAALVLSTKWVIDNTTPTAKTDMRKVWYNEEFINSLSVEVAMFVIVHEVMHIMFKHGLRRGHRHPIVWNWACDYAINLILRDGGFTLWEHCIVDKCVVDKSPVNYKGMSAEQIYDIISAKLKARGVDPDKLANPSLEDLMDAPMDDATKASVERTINQQVSRALAAAKLAGKMPKGLDIVIENLLNPAQKWQELLAEFMQRVVPSSETWHRRNRRFSTVFMPSRGNVGAMGELVIVGDTSGSMMNNKVLDQMGSEINAAIQQMQPERTRVIWADDTDCSNQDVFEDGEEVLLHPKGGGGTDMRKPLAFVEQYSPICVLLITDCFTPWPDEPTPYPLIVGSTTDLSGPDWAMTVHIKVEV